MRRIERDYYTHLKGDVLILNNDILTCIYTLSDYPTQLSLLFASKSFMRHILIYTKGEQIGTTYIARNTHNHFTSTNEIRLSTTYDMRKLFPIINVEKFLKYSGLNGYMELFKSFYDTMRSLFIRTLHLEKQVHNRRILTKSVIKGGSLRFFKWLEENTILFSFRIEHFHSAIRKGQLEMVQYLFQNHVKRMYERPTDIRFAMKKYNHLTCTVENKRFDFFTRSIRYGHMDIAKWLKHKCNHKVDTTVSLNVAAFYGRIEIMEWIMDECKCKCTLLDCLKAAEGKQNNAFKWIWEKLSLSQNLPLHLSFDFEIQLLCIRTDNLELLRWLKMNDYISKRNHDKELCASAIVCDHLDILKWLIEDHGCRPVGLYKLSISHSRLGILKWLVLEMDGEKYKIDDCKDVRNLLYHTLHSVEIFEWFLKNVVIQHDDHILGYALSKNNIDIVKYLLLNGYTLDKSVYYDSDFVFYNNYDFYLWLDENKFIDLKQMNRPVSTFFSF